MSTQLTRTASLAGGFIAERAVRRATAHWRPAAEPDPAAAPSGPPNAVRGAAPSQASDPRILRRWSVAELIARAAAGPRVLA